MIFLSWILRDFSGTWGKVFPVGGQVAEAAWVTERKGTGNWGGRGEGKEWVKNGGWQSPARVRGGDWTNRWEG